MLARATGGPLAPTCDGMLLDLGVSSMQVGAAPAPPPPPFSRLLTYPPCPDIKSKRSVVCKCLLWSKPVVMSGRMRGRGPGSSGAGHSAGSLGGAAPAAHHMTGHLGHRRTSLFASNRRKRAPAGRGAGRVWPRAGCGGGAQVDRAERGFSFMRDGPLDMRMALAGGGSGGCGGVESAEDLVNHVDEGLLGRILRDYGEERAWRSIASRCPAPPPPPLFLPLPPLPRLRDVRPLLSPGACLAPGCA